MTDRVERVRIDRLVLRGVDLDLHDAAALPARVAAALERQRLGGGAAPDPSAGGQDVAAAIAQRIAAAVAGQGTPP
jgi:hypothetical protein